jgi:hypothetical protein
MQSYASEERWNLRKCNAIATFSDEKAAQGAVGELRSSGVDRSAISLTPLSEHEDAERAEMRDEVEGFVAGPGVALTKSMSRGAAVGTVTLGLIGAFLGLLIGLLWGGMPGARPGATQKVFIAVGIFAVMGGTIGFMLGGFLKPRYRPGRDEQGEFEGEPVSPATVPEPEPETRAEMVVSVHLDDEAEFSRAVSVLEGMHPERLDVVGPEGGELRSA